MRDVFLSFAARAYMIASRVPRLTVVTLHRVGPSSGIQPGHIDRCFRFLSKHFHVVRPSDLDVTKCERRTAVVTIDDGHADAYQLIFPIAQATGTPIALCIPTDFFFRGQWLWFDKVTWAMRHARRDRVVQIAGFGVHADDPKSFAPLRRYLKGCPPVKRDSTIHELFSLLDLDPPSSPPDEYRSVTQAELREMLSTGLVQIIGHTATHTIATVLNEAELMRELRESREEWESFCQTPIVSFCYPNGNPGDFNERTATAVRRAGYRYAFTQLEGTNLVRRMDPFEIKRVHIHRRPGVCDKVMSGLVDLQNRMHLPGPGGHTPDESKIRHL